MLFAKYICLITMIGSTNNKLVCIKLFEIKNGNFGIANVFASNIPSQKKTIWHEMVDSLPHVCTLVIKKNFCMLAKMVYRSQNYVNVIYVCERFCWNSIVYNLHVHDIFVHEKNSKKSWNKPSSLYGKTHSSFR